jgi:hypothetical protein
MALFRGRWGNRSANGSIDGRYGRITVEKRQLPDQSFSFSARRGFCRTDPLRSGLGSFQRGQLSSRSIPFHAQLFDLGA